MKVTIVYKGLERSPIIVHSVERLAVVAKDIIETQTFGNGPVQHRGVLTFVAWYNSDEAPKEN
jgi:hypothetical protein